MEFFPVEANLRQSFRVLATDRTGADVMELPGVSIASLGVAFQMFNAAYLNSMVENEEEMHSCLELAQTHFQTRGIAWSFWICEDWLTRPLRRKLSRICQNFDLRLVSEMPGMTADTVKAARRPLPDLEIRRVDSLPVLHDFQAIGSTCFHVPPAWFSEVFDERRAARGEFACFVGYRDGEPVATAASVPSQGAIGIYNVATSPGHRERGYGEIMTRHAIDASLKEYPGSQTVLQATWQGLSLYERMGFRAVTRFSVYNSSR